MAGVTDLPFRQLCRKLGAGLAISEMVSSEPRLRNSAKTRKRLAHHGEVAPRVVQIAGSEPKIMAYYARYTTENDVHIIDINMGCPVKKVFKKKAGAALLGKPALVGRILETVVNAVDVPVTLKIRTGLDPAQRNAVEIARIAENAGIQALSVHGRTRACGYKQAAEYDTIRAIKQMVSIPVIANGDIDSPQKAYHVLAKTGADAIMIGRAARGRPWLFREIDHYLKTGNVPQEPTMSEVSDIMLEHLENLYSFYGDYEGIRVARKHIAWYVQRCPGSAPFRQRINSIENTNQQFCITRKFLQEQIKA